MLTPKNKKAIDGCRQILVSKIPSPEGQIEQITMAMLYKFMDDMDKESSLLGGKAKFFVDEYEKFSWRKLMDQKIGAQDRYNLYTEALEKFYIHPTMDPMFKEMFKNASVPFKEADTLTLFLREVNDGFDYSDSETLGDAYEYLLSDQASQKSLGQFRTPRHIIDFIVDIVKPKKNEIILDPACGTSGFLISAYNYIMHTNMKNKPGDTLNYDEKVEVLNHLTGYDIEPKMVKIARMNMFLHGASNPDIYEYDTLTMDSKWEEKYDVIIANPPFMTPKGGIKPHRKFNIHAKKSEILFVDYIQSHLKVHGRTGIIVPDGIVSNASKQSRSYIDLRKMLVEDKHVYAVVSLHRYIFKPYTDVKTSIIFYDKSITCDNVLFTYVDNDGFEKGERRRPIKENDLPRVKDLIEKYYDCIKNGNEFISDEELEEFNSILVDVDTIKNNQYVLKGERYIANKTNIIDEGKMPLGELIEEYKEKARPEDKIYSISNTAGFVQSTEYFTDYFEVKDNSKYKRVEKGVFAYNPSRINVGSIALFENEVPGCISPMYKKFKIKDEYQDVINGKYLLAILKSEYAKNYINQNRKGVRGQIEQERLEELVIPIPTAEDQNYIVEQTEKIRNLEFEIENLNSNISDKIQDIIGVENMEDIDNE